MVSFVKFEQIFFKKHMSKFEFLKQFHAKHNKLIFFVC
jgi:hypothetical protein